MPSNDSTVRFRADISQLKAAMQQAQRQVRLVNSEFKAATAGMDDWTKSEEGLQAKIKQLNGVLDSQKKQLTLLNQQLERTEQEYGKGSAEADRVKISINNMSAAIAKTEKELEGYNNQLEELPNTLEETGEAAQEASSGFSVMKGALADLVASGVKVAISALKDFAQEAIQVGMDYESAMSKVGAVSGASAEDMEKLNAKAKEMGESTVFSATQSAEAFNYMAMAGWKTEDMLSGIEGVMNLAAASGADLATTSDIVTDALTAMGYGAQDAGMLADVMATAASNANTNVEMMGATFQYAAPLVGALGYSMEDTALAIGLMANAGIKGDKAGTALRSTLNRLSAPPKECAEEMEKLGLSLTDSEGNMKSLNEVMVNLRGAFRNLSETEQTAAAKHIAGAEAMSGLLAIVNASTDDYEKLSQAILNADGAAASMAETMNDNVGGKLTLLKSKIEGIMIKLFEKASGSMKKGIETVGDALDSIDWDNVGEDVGEFAKKAADFFAYLVNNGNTIKSILKTIGTLIATIFVASKINSSVVAITGLVSAFNKAKVATGAFNAVLSTLGVSMSALPIMALVGGIAAAVAISHKYTEEVKANAQATYGLTEDEKELMSAIESTSDALKENIDARKDLLGSFDVEAGQLSSIKKQYNDLIDENGNVKKGYEDLADELLGELANGLGTTIDKVKENIEANGKLGASIDELIRKKKDEAKFEALEEDYKNKVKEEVEAFKELTKIQSEQKDAQEKLTEAQTKYDEALERANNTYYAGKKGANTKELKAAAADLEVAQQKYDELSESVKNASATWGQAQSTIENYQDALAAKTAQDTDKMEDALLSYQAGLVNHTLANKQQLVEQFNDTKASLESVEQLYKQGKIDQNTVDAYKRINQLAGAELDKWVEKNGKAGEAAAGKLGTYSEGLANLEKDVATLSSDTLAVLDTNLGDWGAVAEEKTGDFLHVINGKSAEANASGGNIASATAEGAKSKAPEMEKAADESYSFYDKNIKSHDKDFQADGSFILEEQVKGALDKTSDMGKPGEDSTVFFSKGVENKKGEAKKASETVASEAVSGYDSKKDEAETSGNNFTQGFINGMLALLADVIGAAAQIGASAVGSLKKSQKEGSPSKITYASGEFFSEGFTNGIKEGTKKAVIAAADLGLSSVKSLRKAQQEASPSKLTYESGRNFTQGFINGIVSLEGSLVTKTKNMVSAVLAQLLKLNNFNFSEVTQNASNSFAKSLQKNLNYMINRINYSYQLQLEDFDDTIESLQEASDKAVEAAQAKSTKKQNKIQKKIEKAQESGDKKKVKNLQKKLKKEQTAVSKATKSLQDSYDAQIKEQQKMKDSYSEAAQAMISEFQDAMSEYQSAAQKLIDDTMNGIADDYQSQYDALINKQDSLIEKLKSAGDLFNLSGANVMTINDLQEQTRAIKQYASKLEDIKNKVSSDLFDQIASYDMKEGEAFMDRLLAMSDAELKAYSDAFDEKMSVAESLSKNIYKDDFDKIADNYEKAMKQAFADLPAQLEALGWQTMQGFLSGLTSNTDYMKESVKVFISGMVNTFKQQLGIHSPSKVAFNLGELVGEGFADGLKDMINTVKKAAVDVTDAVTDQLELTSSLSAAKNVVGASAAAAGYRSAGGFSGDKTQIINFTQNNNSPKALDRLTIYRQSESLLFNAKVRLSNV